MIQFENIRTGEVVTFDGTQDPNTRQAHIAAFLNSSDMSPNALKGQDFGWRLAPEIKDEIDRIKGDLMTLDMLSKRIGVPVDELRDFHILNYIAEQDFAQQALAARTDSDNPAYKESYEARLAALKARREQPTVQPVQAAIETAPAMTTNDGDNAHVWPGDEMPELPYHGVETEADVATPKETADEVDASENANDTDAATETTTE